jgi:hypothetical protein
MVPCESMSGLRVLSKERDVLETTLKFVQLSLITRSVNL